jgi:hypothetical protein
MFGYSPTGLVLTSFEIQKGKNKEEHTHKHLFRKLWKNFCINMRERTMGLRIFSVAYCQRMEQVGGLKAKFDKVDKLKLKLKRTGPVSKYSEVQSINQSINAADFPPPP